MSPGLAAMTSRAGAAVPFARAAGLLEDLAGVRLRVKRVERSAEASGAAQATASRDQARLIADRKLVPLPPSPLPDKLYAVTPKIKIQYEARRAIPSQRPISMNHRG